MQYSDEVKEFLKKNPKYPKYEIGLKFGALGRAELVDTVLLFLLMAIFIVYGVFFQIQGWEISNALIAIACTSAFVF